MFRENNEHEQEALFSPVKDLPPGPKKKLDEHWSTYFYEHVFTQIDETKFANTYHDGYSRPNKPVNELVSLEIIKHIRGYSDKELEDAYIFDVTVRNALGKELLNDNISANTFTNFRRRLLEYEEETGRNLLEEVFEEHRDYFIEEFDIDASTQRMDSTFIEANIKQLSRIDLIAKVLHNFLQDLPEEVLQELPTEIKEFAKRENLNLSYQLAPGEVQSKLGTLVKHAAWLADRFKADGQVTQLESFAHLQRVLDEQCYRIPELEDEDQKVELEEYDDHDDDPSSGWEPVRNSGTRKDDTDSDSSEADVTEADGKSADAVGVGLKEPDEIDSDSLQNPHDDEATYQKKNDEHYHGYKANLAETCGSDEELRLITTVQVDTNNTEDTEFLEDVVEELAEETSLEELLNDGGYLGAGVENTCAEAGVSQHFSGIKGRRPDPDAVSVADAEWDGHELVACPAGHAPFDQSYTPENERYWGRFEEEVCGNCPYQEDCFVEERQEFYSYGFYARRLVTARRRAKIADSEEREFLNLRAGAESMINEVYRDSGRRTKFTGRVKVQNASIATAIGTNLKRAARSMRASESKAEEAVT